MEAAKNMKVFSGHNDKVNCCYFSMDGTKIISGSNDKSIKIWD